MRRIRYRDTSYADQNLIEIVIEKKTEFRDRARDRDNDTDRERGRDRDNDTDRDRDRDRYIDSGPITEISFIFGG